MSRKSNCAKFLFQLSDLGCEMHYPPLRDGARTLLQLIPPDQSTVNKLKQLFETHGNYDYNQENSVSVESVFFDNSCSKVLYHIEVSKVIKPDFNIFIHFVIMFYHYLCFI